MPHPASGASPGGRVSSSGSRPANLASTAIDTQITDQARTEAIDRLDLRLTIKSPREARVLRSKLPHDLSRPAYDPCTSSAPH